MKKRFKILIVISLMAASTLTLIGAPSLAAAQESSSTEATSEEKGGTIPKIPRPELLPGPNENQTQEEVQKYFREEAIPSFINGFLGLVAGFSLLALIVSGIRFIVAYGEEEAITAAKKTATWSLIGFGITLLAFAIVSIINTLAFPKGTGTYEGDKQENVEYEDI